MDKRRNIANIYPLSPMQQGILFHTLLAPESGIYLPQIVLTLEGELNATALHQAWQQAVTHHDVLRTAFYWEQRDEPFQVVYRQADLPWVQQDWRDQPPELQATRLQVFLDCNQTQPFNLHTPPLMRLALIQVSDYKHHLICAYHHLILDGWSTANLLKTVFTQYFSVTGSPHPPIPPSPHLPDPRLPIHPPTHSPPYPPTPHPPYTTYLTWLQSQNPAATQTYWQTHLQGFQEPTPLPIWITPSPQSAAPGEHRTEQQHRLSIEQTAQLQTFAQQHQLTLNTLIQGAFGLLLSRYCDQDDVVFGATSAGRPPSILGSEAMVGLFINTLPVRVQVSEDIEVVTWLQQLQQDRGTASAYDYSSLMDVQTWSELPAGQSLFDCLLVVENYPVNADMLAGQSALALTDVRFIEWTHFPLTLLVATGERLTLTAKYSQNRVTDDAIHRLLTHLETLLLGLTTHSRLRDVPLLTSTEQTQIHLWNQTATDYPLDCTLPELIEAQVERTPKAVAVSFKDKTLTYRDLDTRANQLAHHLQTLGVGPETPVAVCLERSLDLVIALLAILKAGGAYLPLDPEYPPERLAFMLENSQATVLITTSALLPGQMVGSAHPTVQIVDLMGDLTPITHHPITSPPHHSPSPQSPISLLYTSGSTGRPKGVINTHRGLVNRLCWMQDAYPLTASDRVLQKTPLSFDVSAWELFWPLITGASLVLAKPAGHKDSAYLVELIHQQHITTLHFVPAMLAAFLEAPNVAQCTRMKRVICSGEALPHRLQTQFFQTLPTVELHNLYGPTEASIDVTAWTCPPCPDSPPTATVPIGRPIANTQIYLLDSRDRPVPPGIPGELHISGIGLARGYLNRPDLTAEKFVPNPFLRESVRALESGSVRTLERGSVRTLERGSVEENHQSTNPSTHQRTNAPTHQRANVPTHQRANVPTHYAPTYAHTSTLYKTGDLARYRPDGTLEFLGRIDHQVKLRGFRIELGEIEAVLTQHPDISQAVVVLREDKLVAYVVKAEGDQVSGTGSQVSGTRSQDLPDTRYPIPDTPPTRLPIHPSTLHQHLSHHLPPHMLPSQFVTLDALPLLPNGKVNQKALPKPDQPTRAAARSPQTVTEQKIAGIWQEVLKLAAVGADDNFFELGGNSLSATRVNTRLRKAFELEMPLRVMFERPTIAELAVHIDAMQMTLNQPVAEAAGRKEIEL